MAEKNQQNINIEAYQKAVKAIDNLYKKQKYLEKSTEFIKDSWEGISMSLLGMSGSKFFEKVTKSSQDIASQTKEFEKANASLKIMEITLNESFKGFQKGAKKLGVMLDETSQKQKLFDSIKKQNIAAQFKSETEIKELQDKIFEKLKLKQKIEEKDLENLGLSQKSIKEILKTSKQIGDEYKKPIGSIKGFEELSVLGDEWKIQRYIAAIQENKIDELIKKEGKQAALVLSTLKDTTQEQKNQLLQYAKANEEVKNLAANALETEKTIFNWKKGLLEFAKNLKNIVINKLVEFDNTIHEGQQQSGIMFTKNELAMTSLTMKTAEFGMSIAETVKLMEVMSDTLNTTDFNLLSNAADSLKAVQMATGASAESIGTMSAEMMRMGASSDKLEEKFSDINVSAKMFGVSSKKSIESISKNFVRFRSMGFTGGIESLKKMTNMALRLGQNVDEIFDVSKKARTIEGAMDMAAQLQLAGGSFASAVNPMELLSAARKGPQEMQKLLGKMGSDIGHFAKNANGEMEYAFDPVDKDRLEIVAQATGETVEGIQNRIAKMATDNKKLKMMPDFKFDGIKDEKGNLIDPESIKATLADSVDINGVVLKDSFFGKKGITDLSKLSQRDLEKIMIEKAANEKNLEEQAKQNMSLTKSFDALKNTLLNMFTVFQPLLDGLTWFFQGITSVINWIKSLPLGGVILSLGALTAALFLLLPPLVGGLGKMVFAMNPKNLSNIFKSGGIQKAMDAKNLVGNGEKNPLSPATDAATQSEKVKPTAGGGLFGFAKTLGMVFKEAGKYDLKGIGMFALAITSLLIPLAGIALIFGALGGDPLILLAMGAGLVGMAYAIKLVGEAKINIGNVLMMALAMGIVGLALIPFAYAAKIMNDVDWMSVLAGVGILTLVVVGLMVLGAMMMGPQILALLLGVAILVGVATSLAMVGASFMVLSSGLKGLAEVDWSTFSGIGPALMGVAGGLAVFALAGLLFVNPIMLLGMALMISTLLAISLVLIPLSLALEMGGKGLDSMASGVMKLSDSLSKLDLAKLEELREFSGAMSLAALAGGAMTAMVAVIDAIGRMTGSGEKEKTTTSGEGRPIVVQLVANGRVLQEVMVKDTQKYS